MCSKLYGFIFSSNMWVTIRDVHTKAVRSMLFLSDSTDNTLQADALVTLLHFGWLSPGIRHGVMVSSCTLWKNNDISVQMVEKLSYVEVIKQRQGHSKVRKKGWEETAKVAKDTGKVLVYFPFLLFFSSYLQLCRKFLSRKSQEEINTVTVRLLD
jgi:hypothetical protein